MKAIEKNNYFNQLSDNFVYFHGIQRNTFTDNIIHFVSFSIALNDYYL